MMTEIRLFSAFRMAQRYKVILYMYIYISKLANVLYAIILYINPGVRGFSSWC